MISKKYAKLLLLIFAITLLAGCKTASSTKTSAAPDYSSNKYWSIKDKVKHEIDVFFVHPTTYGPPANGKYVADLDNKQLNKVTDRDTVNWQTAVFSEKCNIFAPRYRQVNIEVLGMDKESRDAYLQVGISDVEAAFKYYLNNINNGRPFIIASHSQGSNALLEMLLQNPNLLDKSKLVAAYMPGWTITDKDIADLGLSLSEKPDQTGCLIVWNTIGPGGNSPTIKKGARCVNPLSWNTRTQEYPASMNIEAKIFISPGNPMLIKNFTAARINKNGALEIPSPDPAVVKQLNMSMGKEVYHRYDYDFFFYNIKKNVKQRCEAYLKKHK